MAKALSRSLVNHRVVARAFGVSTSTLMRAVQKGNFPVPHSILNSFYLFDKATIEHRLEKGTWPSGTKFRGITREAPSDEGSP